MLGRLCRRFFLNLSYRKHHISSCSAPNPGTNTLQEDSDLQAVLKELESGLLPSNNEVYSWLLRKCAVVEDLDSGTRVCSHISTNRQNPDVFLTNGVVEMYAKCGALDRARSLFDEMLWRNSYSWNIMVAAYAREGDHEKTFAIFQAMELEGFTPYKHSYSNMLTACASLEALAPGRDIHPDIVARGLEDNVIIATALINLYGKCGCLRAAERVFERIQVRDVICWSSMIALMVQQERYSEAIELFRGMLLDGVVPEDVTLVSLVAACTGAGAIKVAQEFHRSALICGYRVDEILGGALVNLYGKFGMLEAAEELHETMIYRTVISWTALIAAYTQTGHPHLALHCCRRMDQEGVKPNEVSFLNLLGAFCSPELLGFGRGIHLRLVETGFVTDGVLGTAVLNMYGKCGRLTEAKKVFDSMKIKDTIAWNAMLASLAHLGFCGDTCKVWCQMQLEGCKSDEGTLVSVLDACGELENGALGKGLQLLINGTWLEQLGGVTSALINMFGKCGEMQEVLNLFHAWRKPSLLPLNAFAAAFVQFGSPQEAIQACMVIDHEGLRFDEGTFVTLFCACSSLLGDGIHQGRMIHHRLLSSGLSCNITVWNSLINMYGKCGSVEDAKDVFDKLVSRDVVTWNAMFAAYAENRDSLQSLHLLRLMDHEGVKADEVTLVSVLTACAGSADMEESQKLHERAEACGMESGDAVGGLLVNAYGKCGSLEIARKIFDKMKRRNLFTWTALLASYAQHGFGREALEVYRRMDLEGLKPSKITFLSILFACSHAGLIEEGKHYFLSMTSDHCLEANEDHYRCVLDLFARVGLLSEVEELIGGLQFSSDQFSWMTLLSACRVHSDFKRANRAAENTVGIDPESSMPWIMLLNFCTDNESVI